jgi:phosphohistidine phosphatase
MKRLMLIRHAEAEGHSDKGDFERALSVLGKREAAQLAKKLQTQTSIPELFICSPALRTVTTAGILTSHFQLSPAQTNAAIYEASEKTLLNVINYFPNNTDYVAMVGHNPGISYLLLNLTGEVRDIPTCTAVTVTFEDAETWQEVSHNTGVITYYTTSLNS